MHKARRNILLWMIALGCLSAVGWGVYQIVYTVGKIPEAYAAWDTGTLLVAYMQKHDNHWPTSWDDLLTIMADVEGRKIPLRGAQAGDVTYARSLCEKVKVDWSFNPHGIDQPPPISRSDGKPFPVVWQHAEPNAMVRAHLNAFASP